MTREVTIEEFCSEATAAVNSLVAWCQKLGPDPVRFWKLRMLAKLDRQIFVAAMCQAERAGLVLVAHQPGEPSDKLTTDAAVRIGNTVYIAAKVAGS